MLRPDGYDDQRVQNSLHTKILYNPKFCTESLVDIVNKERKTIPFLLNPSQSRYYHNRTHRDIILKARQLGFCLDPNTRVLTADLKWVTLQDIKVGQEIVAIDEFTLRKGKGSARKMRTAIVEKKSSIFSEAIKLTMEDGRELIATGEHKFLSRNINNSWEGVFWKKVKDFKINDEIRQITTPWEEGNFKDGWFGGILDGEGSMRKKQVKSGRGICVGQQAGPLFDKMEEYVKVKGYNYVRTSGPPRKGGWGKKIMNGIGIIRMDELFRMIGQTRPERFIKNRWWENKELPGKGARKTKHYDNVNTGWKKIVKIEILPKKQELIDLQTSTKTYIAEGFVSHNSTLIMALFLHDTMFVPNTISLIVAQTDKDAADLFDRVKFMLYSIPEIFRPHIKSDNHRMLFFDKINSRYFIGSAESKDFGRSKTISNLHLSEFSHPYFKREFFTGIIESVPASGWVVIESTARGEGNMFHQLYLGAKRRENEYRAHYYRWFEHEEYQLPIFTGEKLVLTEQELDLKRKYRLSLEQIKWRRSKVALHGNKFIQEYPELEDEDAFIKTGSPCFDNDWLRARNSELLEQHPAEIWLGGELFIYKIAEAGARYVIGCDPSEGDINSDYSAASVVKAWPPPIEQVALLHGKWTPDVFSEKIWRIGYAYNKAAIAVERNNHGHAVLLNLGNGIVRNGALKYTPYPQLYVGPDKKLGWLTTGLSKSHMIEELDRAMRSGQLVVNCKKFIEEARSFNYLGASKMGAPSGGHDDIVMSMAIAAVAIAGSAFDFSF
jgi:hypothetical protein